METFKTSILTVSVFATAFIFLLLLQPETAKAQWHDNSGNLPGTGLSPASKGLLAASGVLAGGSLTYLIVRKVRKNKKSATSYGTYIKQDILAMQPQLPSLNMLPANSLLMGAYKREKDLR